MCEFVYTIKDEIGIHARPAGAIVKIAKESKSRTEMENRGRIADLKKIFSIMSQSVKCGDVVTVRVGGEDEKETADKLKKYITENL